MARGKSMTPLELFRLLRNGPLSRLDILNKFNAEHTQKIRRSVLDNVIRSGIALNYISERNSLVRLNPQKIGELERAFAASEEPNSESDNSSVSSADNQNIKEKKAIGKKRKAEKIKIRIRSVPKKRMAANKNPKNKSIAKRAIGKKRKAEKIKIRIPSVPKKRMAANKNPKNKSIVKMQAIGKKRKAEKIKMRIPSVPKKRMAANKNHKNKFIAKMKRNEGSMNGPWIVPRLPKIKHKARRIKPKRKGKNDAYNLNRQFMEAKKMARDNQMAIQLMLVPKKPVAKKKACTSKALYSIKICKQRMPKRNPKGHGKIKVPHVSHISESEDDESYSSSSSSEM